MTWNRKKKKNKSRTKITCTATTELLNTNIS